MKRGFDRSRILIRTKFEKQFSTIRNRYSILNFVKSFVTSSLVITTVTMPVPSLAASSEALVNDDSGPVPDLVREVDGAKTLNHFAPESTKLLSVNSLSQIEVAKSVASIKDEEEQARVKAEEEAAAAAKKKTTKKVYATLPTVNMSYGDIQKVANQMVSAVFGESEWAAMNALIIKESGYNPNAVNSRSGACGLPQALPCSKLGDKTVEGQINWMINYIKNRYGTPSNALSFHNSHNWY